MHAPTLQRPTRNGSSNSTVEILITLVVVGASALTAMALARPGRGSDGAAPPPEDESDDERSDGS